MDSVFVEKPITIEYLRERLAVAKKYADITGNYSPIQALLQLYPELRADYVFKSSGQSQNES